MGNCGACGPAKSAPSRGSSRNMRCEGSLDSDIQRIEQQMASSTLTTVKHTAFLRILPIAEVKADPTLWSSFVHCFSTTFGHCEVLAQTSQIPIEDMRLFAEAYLDLSAAEGLSYAALDGDSVVAFLLIEDGSGPLPHNLHLAEAVEAAVCPALGRIFSCIEAMQELYQARTGGVPQRGEVLHVLAAGAFPSVRGSNITNAMLLRCVWKEVYLGQYRAVVTEATGFASQRLMSKQYIPGEEWGFVISKPYAEFTTEDGLPLFPCVQTPTVALLYQKMGGPHSHLGPAEMAAGGHLDFQSTLLYASTFPQVIERAPSAQQLRLLALHRRGALEQPTGPKPNRLKVVKRAIWDACKSVEALSREEAMQQFVDLVTKISPTWKDDCAHITKVGPIHIASGTADMRSAIWVPDSHSVYCQRCEDSFNSYRRRHHCRRCGLTVCNSCSQQRRKLQGWEDVQRVCDTCAAACDN